MNITRRTLAKVASGLALIGSIPAVAKAMPTDPTMRGPGRPISDGRLSYEMIGLMHYVEPNTLFNGDMKLPYGYWATSYVDDLLETPQWGDTFSNWPDLGTRAVPTPEQQLSINYRSYQSALRDLNTEFCDGEQRYIRHRDGTFINWGRAPTE